MSAFFRFAIASLLAIAACGDATAPSISSVTFASGALTLLIDDEAATQVTVSNTRGETVANPAVTYVSSSPAIATVDSTGKVRGVSQGTAIITATVASVSAQLLVTVNWPPVQTVDLQIANGNVFVEDTVPTTVSVTNSKGNPATNASVLYATSDAAIATVDAQGRVSGIGPGTATITATAGGVSDQVQVTVAWPPVVSLAFVIDTAALMVDDTIVTSVVVLNSRGRVARNAVVSFSSSAGSVATVNTSGRIIALLPGTTSISATVETFQDVLPVTVTPHFTSLTMGEIHTCGIRGTGGLFCWGTDAARQLGQPSQVMCLAAGQCSLVPLRVQGNQRFVQVTAGSWHTCALNDAGAAYCWGSNDKGQLGTGATSTGLNAVPTAVAGGLTFTSLRAGRWHTCGITTASETWCWGWDNTGELGTGTAPPARCDNVAPCSRVPVKVVGGHTFVGLDLRENASCGITGAGAMYCWGLDVGGNETLECQNSLPTDRCTRTPLLQASGTTYASMFLTSGMRCGRTAGGAQSCWGVGFYGEYGNGVAFFNTATPTAIAGGATFAQIAGGRTHICGRESDGSVKCWGQGTYGSGGSAPDRTTPVVVGGGIAFTTITSGSLSGSVCGLTAAGRAYCWGDGRFGQLGDNNALTRFEPVQVRAPR